MSLKKMTPVLLLAGLFPVALAAQQESSVQVEVVIATSVEDREPVGGGTTFPADVGTLTAWTRVTGAANTTIEHVWRFGDNERVISVNIGGSPWRTWTTKNIPPEWTGEWTLEVRTSGGQVLSTATFTVGSNR